MTILHTLSMFWQPVRVVWLILGDVYLSLRYTGPLCYKLYIQGFRVTCLFPGQYNTKGYDTITDVI